MLKNMTLKTAQILAAAMTGCFLAIHIALFLFFNYYGVTPMVYVNYFSMIFYLIMIIVVRRAMFRVFVVAVYLEVLIHMFLAAYYTGIESGFQITLIGITILVYYSEYVGRYLHLPTIKSVPLSILGGLTYAATIVVDYLREVPYPLPADVCFYLQLAWGIIIFSIASFFLYTFVEITISSHELLSKQADHDQLTGLANRYYLLSHLEKRKTKEGLENCWIAMIDIDDFKKINDTHGHNCGDVVLRELSVLIRDVKLDMTFGRWGGEEFLLFGEIKESLDEIFRTLDQFRETVAKNTCAYGEDSLQFTITIGLAAYVPGKTIDQWIEQADQHMYVGKRNGKNQVVL